MSLTSDQLLKTSAFLPKGSLLWASYRTNVVIYSSRVSSLTINGVHQINAIVRYNGSEIMSSVKEDAYLHIFMYPSTAFNISASIKGLTEQNTTRHSSAYKARDAALITPSDKEL